MEENKTLYWVQFIDQSSGHKIDTYFLAYSLKQLEEEISDILSIKVIDGIQDLTTDYTPKPKSSKKG